MLSLGLSSTRGERFDPADDPDLRSVDRDETPVWDRSGGPSRTQLSSGPVHGNTRFHLDGNDLRYKVLHKDPGKPVSRTGTRMHASLLNDHGRVVYFDECIAMVWELD